MGSLGVMDIKPRIFPAGARSFCRGHVGRLVGQHVGSGASLPAACCGYCRHAPPGMSVIPAIRRARLHLACLPSLPRPEPSLSWCPAAAPAKQAQPAPPALPSPLCSLHSVTPFLRPLTSAAGALNIICNFAELVVREMERDKVSLVHLIDAN